VLEVAEDAAGRGHGVVAPKLAFSWRSIGSKLVLLAGLDNTPKVQNVLVKEFRSWVEAHLSVALQGPEFSFWSHRSS